jgi:chaperonin GroEL
MTAHRKAQAASKRVQVRTPELEKLVVNTMKTIADIVGATLGPGGSPVLIERQDFGLPPLVTKDGVTVFSNLGFEDPVAQSVMESARDAAVRTVSEAGDGTTTATVLAYALVKYAQKFHSAHPHVPPQRIVQTVQQVFEQVIEPRIKDWATKVDISTKKGKKLCRSVASISANGEVKLADAVMECFDIIGDKGNVSLSEKSGPSGYTVEKVEGFPIPTGFEDSCGKFMHAFMNDTANNRVFLEQPVVLLYNGTITDFATIVPVLNIIISALSNGVDSPLVKDYPKLSHPGVVLVANGFSDAVQASLMVNWEKSALKVFPVVTPRSALMNGEVHFLEDLAAVTGARVFNPASMPFDQAAAIEQDAVGNIYHLPWLGRTKEFESLRFRSTIIGVNDEDEVIERAETLEAMAKSAISELDRRLIEERRAALVGGIAKLFVVGSSTGDIRERKDRADDAVRAVQGALKAGVLPGGGWTLLKLVEDLKTAYGPHNDTIAEVVKEVICPALREPFIKLVQNVGLTKAEFDVVEPAVSADDSTVWDAANNVMVDAFDSGILDSVPAVLEAIRNSVAIATLLGTLGGVVVFNRDSEMELEEARAALDFDKNASVEIANEHW